MGNRKYSDRKPKKEQKSKFIIVCCGLTEKIYFEQLKRKFGFKGIEVVYDSKSQTKKVINEAIKRRTENTVVWAVFDKDNEEANEFNKQIDRAKKSKINYAFSNLSFEYWIYLHFSNEIGALTKSSLESAIEAQYAVNYDKKEKSTTDLCNKIISRAIIEKAINNAKLGHQTHSKNYTDDPSKWWSCSTVYLLIEKMREWSDSLK